jgi:hypothetical protein
MVAPPVTVPVNVGAFQLYVLPSGTMPFVKFVGVTTKATPLHVTVLIVLISAVGGTVTVTVNGAPLPQVDIFGVTIYVAVCVLFVVFRNVPNTLD